jgi:hypothetical protein
MSRSKKVKLTQYPVVTGLDIDKPIVPRCRQINSDSSG